MKKKNVMPVLALSLLLLSSCRFRSFEEYFNSATSMSVEGISDEVTEDKDDLSVEEGTVDLTKNEAYASGRKIFNSYLKHDGYYSTALNNQNRGQPYLPSTGNSKILVVPVSFVDQNFSKDDQVIIRNALYKAFFGEEDETSWESVRSYYYKSSYHQLYLGGAVAPLVRLNHTFGYYSGIEGSYNSIVEQVYARLFTGQDPVYKVSQFDSDNDGFIDGIYLVNTAGIDNSGNNELGWAFTTWHTENQGKDAPIGTYSWSSVYFMTRNRNQGSFTKPDAHTYIHETGHMLGLNDYYDSDNNNMYFAGGPTMQDENICDHEPYSKYLLGWTSPYVVTDKNKEETIELTLRPSVTSGDCLILTSDFNGTALDEYLMIDYYTPTGLNKNDSFTTYENVRGVDESGIRIFHIDNNIYESAMMENGISFDPNPVKEVKADENSVIPDDINEDSEYQFYHSFSTNATEDYLTKQDFDKNFYIRPEIEWLRKNEKETSSRRVTIANSGGAILEGVEAGINIYRTPVTADSLFRPDDEFGEGFEFYSPESKLPIEATAEDYKNAGRITLPYKIKVESINDNGAKILLTRINNSDN